jgi:hypothetical protein
MDGMSAIACFHGVFAGVRELGPGRVVVARTPFMHRHQPAVRTYESFTWAMQRP